ncbi:DUF2332 domain-containing protein [Pseudonocardia sp.]|uniref:DUF2332 domain-containing protein n=1 Tax=Pseudonocardia sp. TaxID=60912 RepID=UPI003D12AF62
MGPSEHRDVVAAQARSVARAWSPPGAPPSWWLTAETFATIAEDDVLLDLATAIPPDRLPALLLSAALRRRIDELRPRPLTAYYPVPGGSQPPRDGGFRPALHAFALAEAQAIGALCAGHRYQMNEVGRCLDVLPALAEAAASDPRPLALVDLGTGAGLGLHLDRYAYRYALPDGTERVAGDPGSPVRLSCTVRSGRPPVPAALRITHRVGVDAEPLDVTDPATAAWLTACVPPEVGAVTRFAAALDLVLDLARAPVLGAAFDPAVGPVLDPPLGPVLDPAPAQPVPAVRGDLVDALPGVVAEIPADTLLCLVDTYVHVFLPPDRLARFHALVDEIGRERDLVWISVDPLVPLGPAADASVQGMAVPAAWVRDNREGGVFGVVGQVSVRDGRRTGAVLGRAHPGSAWLEWLVG